MSGYSRDNVKTHYGSERPAVNVKVYDSIEDGWRKFLTDETPEQGFSLDWIRSHISDEQLDRLFWLRCEADFEMVQSDAEEILGVRAEQVERDGRSGGWAVVTGLPDLEDWDAVQLAKWRKFERFTRDTADWIMAGVVELVYLNDWEWWKARGPALRRADGMLALA